MGWLIKGKVEINEEYYALCPQVLKSCNNSKLV